MKDLIENFPAQLEEALKIAASAKLSAPPFPLQNVLISGLGGSGIGGTIAAQLVENTSPVPITVNKKYTLPGFVNQHTLVIISSYSGNTEETVNVMKEALIREAKIVCITSGGEIASMAKASGLDLITVPPGMPPRACLGYSLVQLLHIFQFYQITTHKYTDEIREAITFLRKEQQQICLEAKLLAERLQGRIPVIYAADDKEGIAIRFRQQINENSKMLTWHHVFPEMNHNELVGWRNENDRLAVVLFRTSGDLERIGIRMDISNEIFRKYTPHIFEVKAKGKNPLQSQLYLIHFGDWVSWYLAELNQVDATEVKVIDHLKSELSRV